MRTGAEPIAGSTRMNAGTAQRVILNLLSTLVMIRLGRVYRGLMVDVQAANAKLANRKEEMLVYLTGRTRKDAQRALASANGSVKLAVLLLHGCGVERAQLSSSRREEACASRLIASLKAAGPTVRVLSERMLHYCLCLRRKGRSPSFSDSWTCQNSASGPVDRRMISAVRRICSR